MIRRWSDGEVAQMIEMMDNGCPSSEIANALGRTEKAVEHKKSLLRHPKPKTSRNTSTKKIELTPQLERWLIRHFKHTKNDVIMERFGLSHSTLHRFARALGLTKTRQFIKKTQQECATAAKESHLRNGTYPPKGFRIPKSDYNRFKPGVTPEMRLGKKRNQERIAKAAASRRETVRKERSRIIFGFDQKTKLKLVHNRKRAIYRYALKKRGYLVERGGREAKVIETTIRSEIVEQRAAKHGIIIIATSLL